MIRAYAIVIITMGRKNSMADTLTRFPFDYCDVLKKVKFSIRTHQRVVDSFRPNIGHAGRLDGIEIYAHDRPRLLTSYFNSIPPLNQSESRRK